MHVVPVGVVVGVGADPGDGDNEEDNGGKDEDAAQGGFVVAETPPCVLPQAASVYRVRSATRAPIHASRG